MPVTTGLRVVLRERDLVWLDKLHRHGPLSTPYLIAFTEHTHKRSKWQQKRLCDLFNEEETPHGGTYLDRPWRQFETLDARQHDLVYDLNDRSTQVLKEANLWTEYAPVRAGSWRHTYMVSCITASIELATLKAGNVRYIPQDEILSRAQTHLTFPVTFERHAHNLIPDALFGLEYTTNGESYYRFFIVEADRATEPTSASSYDRKTYERTIRQYKEFIGGGQYKDALKLSAGIVVLNVTTSERRMQGLIDMTEKVMGGHCNYMLFSHVDEFGYIFKPPKVLYRLFSDPWQRAGAPFAIHTP